MVAGTTPILTHAGVLDDTGKLSDSAHAAFVANVVTLLTKGNVGGKGLFLSSALDVAFPPSGGPSLPAPSLANPTLIEPILWFGPDPTAALSIPYLSDRDGVWSKMFVDGFYAAVLKALNLNGSYVPPIFDPTIYGLDMDFDLKVDLPTLAIKIPEIITPKLPDLLLKLGIPKLDIPPIPAIPPTILLPSIPPIPSIPGLDPKFNITLVLPEFFKLIALGIPPLIIPKFPPALSLPDLFLIIPLIELFLKVMIDLNIVLVSPKLLVATMLVMLQNISIALACDAVGLILGSGSIVKAVATFGGLASG